MHHVPYGGTHVSGVQFCVSHGLDGPAGLPWQHAPGMPFGGQRCFFVLHGHGGGGAAHVWRQPHPKMSHESGSHEASFLPSSAPGNIYSDRSG